MIHTKNRIQKDLHTKWLGQNLKCLADVDSTNLEVLRLAEEGAGHGTVVTAETQYAGKGSRGRSWDSQAGKGIFMSILLRPEISPAKASMLTLVTAHEIAQVFKNVYELDVKIKWPNDIVLNRRKIAGILTQMQVDAKGIHHVVVGIGVNVNTESFPEELADKATSLFLEGGRTYDKDRMTAEFLNRLETAYDRFLEIGDLSFIKNSYEAFLINRGEQVRILDGRSSEEWTGAALGINEYGELLIQHKDGSIEEVSSGEVSVRGLYSYV